MAKGEPLRLEVWRFVRLMVALETMPEGAAMRAWGGAWREIDERLARLGRADAAAFSALMMDEEAVLPAPGAGALEEAVRALRKVDRELGSALARCGPDAERRAALEFERRELRESRKALARRAADAK